MSAFYRILFVLGFLPFLAIVVGCSSSLSSVERKSAVDRMYTVNGWSASDASVSQKQKLLAVDEILCRPIDAKPHQGYSILVANWGYGVKTIKVYRKELFAPEVVTFVLSDGGQAEYYAMPGSYNVEVWEGDNNLLASKEYEVTTAPVITNVATPSGKKRYHGIWGWKEERFTSRYGIN